MVGGAQCVERYCRQYQIKVWSLGFTGMLKIKNLILYFVVLLFVPSVYAQIKVDGNLADWKGIEPLVILDQVKQLSELPGNWQGPDDLSGTIYLTQDANNIYIAAEVRDDKPLWDPRGSGGIQGRLGRNERPGADAGVCGTKLKGGKQPEQHEFVQWSS